MQEFSAETVFCSISSASLRQECCLRTATAMRGSKQSAHWQLESVLVVPVHHHNARSIPTTCQLRTRNWTRTLAVLVDCLLTRRQVCQKPSAENHLADESQVLRCRWGPRRPSVGGTSDPRTCRNCTARHFRRLEESQLLNAS